MRLLLVSGLVLMATAASAAESIANFPVSLDHSHTPAGLTLSDLDHDGRQELVAIVDEGVAVIGSDGVMWPGFPKGLREADAKTPVMLKGPPTVCDLDGDGVMEIAVAGSSRMVYAVNRAGEEVAGYPVKLQGNPRGALSCMPAANGREDLVLSTDAGFLVKVAGGGPPRVLGRIGHGAEGGVAVADLDGDGLVELITGGGDSRLYVFDANGKQREGFPYKMAFRTSGIPAVGDIDDDGSPDIVFGSQDFKIHALDAHGKPLAGFPVATKYRIYGGAALADLDGDWVLEVVLGSGDKNIYALDGDGSRLRGFPVSTGARIEEGCVVGDVDRDGRLDIFAVTGSGKLLWRTATGKARKLRTDGKVVAGPVLGDLDADGVPEVIFAVEGAIHALEVGVTGKADVAALEWPVAGHDAGHSGRYGPNAARFRDLGLTVEAPATTDTLEAKYSFFDLDWEAEAETRVRWYRDGTHVVELDDQKTVDPSFTAKHQKWRYSLQGAVNHGAHGETGILSRVYRSPELEIRNTVPTAPGIELSPASPRATVPLQVEVTTPSQDPDNDELTYRYVWLRNGKMVPKLANRVAPKLTRKNQEWRIVVVPFDGEQEGETATATVSILNTPPGQPRVSVAPPAPRIDDLPKVVIEKPAPDDDNDAIHYSYHYRVDDRPLALPETAVGVPPRVLRKHQKVTVAVVAHDDEEPGGRVETTFEIQNTPPPAPEIAIWPADPRTRNELRLAVVEQKADADRDAIQLEHRWSVDGTRVEHPTTVSREVTRKGQRWKLEVTPFDGESRGATVVAETTILNTVPEPPLATLPRYEFSTDETITPTIVVPARDDDGDPVTLRYSWLRDGAKSRVTGAALAPSETAKGQRWEVGITPHDGETAGRAVSLRFEVVNSQPSVPEVAVSNPAPTVRDAVDVRIPGPASDKDGDRITYRYTWVRDGVRVGGWKASKARLEPSEMRKGQRWRVEVRAFDGEVEGEPGFADLVVQNHVPAPPRVAVEPAQPRTTDRLECARPDPGTDPDGDPLTYRTVWLVDGEPVSMSLDGTRVPSAMTREKQVWQCEVTAFDGDLISEPVRSAPVTVLNTPPRAPTVSIAPAEPTTETELVCQLDRPSEDADLDNLEYRFVWMRDGKRWKGSGPRVPPSATRRGDSWECVVTPWDGEAEGSRARTRTVIVNSPPSPARARVAPETPRAGDELQCEVFEESRDADGDRVRYSFVWLKDGVPQSYAPTSATVPGRMVKGRDVWQCRVTPNDGQVDGESRTSEDVMVRANGKKQKHSKKKRK